MTPVAAKTWRKRLWRLLLALVATGLALLVFGVASAQRDPIVVRYRIVLPGLTAPLRLVQLSDSHASAIDMPASRLARVVDQINALHADIVVLTGDYVSGNPDRWSKSQTRAALAPFGKLRAQLGVFAALGNHDDRVKTAAALKGGPVQLLVGERVDVGPVLVVGADDIQRGSPAVEAMRRAIRAAPPGKPLLVIAHEPVFFTWLQPGRPVLMIVGHTHGGQVYLPVVGSTLPTQFYRDHRRGMFHEGLHTLLVSSGLGTTDLPIRIGVPPEIVELTLLPGQPGRNSGTDK